MSDLQSTEVEDEIQTKKRKYKPNLKYANTVISSEDEYDENCDPVQPLSKLYKPGETNIIYTYKNRILSLFSPQFILKLYYNIIKYYAFSFMFHMFIKVYLFFSAIERWTFEDTIQTQLRCRKR